MAALKILVLCVCAALICTFLRGVQPQMASVLAMAAGVAALLLSIGDISAFANAVKKLDQISGGGSAALMKLCALAMVAEFASDICRDAGEASLAKRIDTGVRIGIVATAIPSAGEIIASISGVLQ